MNNAEDTLLSFGEAVKALASDDAAKGRLGGYLVRFGSESETDLYGEFFTKDTYFGAQLEVTGKAIIDGTLNHRIAMVEADMPEPRRATMRRLASKFLPPVTVTKDEIGLFAEIVLDLKNDYEKALYDMGLKGAWGWSSGSAQHVVDIESNGWIKSWPIIEGGMTPTPAEFRDSNKLIPLKTYMERYAMEDVIKAADEVEAELPFEETPEAEPIKKGAMISRTNLTELEEVYADTVANGKAANKSAKRLKALIDKAKAGTLSSEEAEEVEAITEEKSIKLSDVMKAITDLAERFDAMQAQAPAPVKAVEVEAEPDPVEVPEDPMPEVKTITDDELKAYIDSIN